MAARAHTTAGGISPAGPMRLHVGLVRAFNDKSTSDSRRGSGTVNGSFECSECDEVRSGAATTSSVPRCYQSKDALVSKSERQDGGRDVEQEEKK